MWRSSNGAAAAGRPVPAKPVLLIALSAVVACGFFWAARRRPPFVPRGPQNVGEVVCLFVRDRIAWPMPGRRPVDALPAAAVLPCLNPMGTVPQHPVASGFAVPLVPAAFERFVQALQARIFTPPAASYIKRRLY